MASGSPNPVEDFREFYLSFLVPCTKDLLDRLESSETDLVFVREKILAVGCVFDYLKPVWDLHAPLKGNAHSKGWQGHQIAERMDMDSGHPGTRFVQYKYRLIHIVNQGIKHIRAQHGDKLPGNHGEIGFCSLRQVDGTAMYETGAFRFDFARVVLRPACEHLLAKAYALSSPDEDHLDYILPDDSSSDHAPYDPDEDDIDQMIRYTNPECLDCGLLSDDCKCSRYLYDGKPGDFEPDFDPAFDFESTMSRISGAYKRD